jgi:hypothetical protein
MEITPSSSNSEKAAEVKQGNADEAKFISQFAEITGATEVRARNVYMYSDIIRERDPYSYRLE